MCCGNHVGMGTSFCLSVVAETFPFGSRNLQNPALHLTKWESGRFKVYTAVLLSITPFGIWNCSWIKFSTFHSYVFEMSVVTKAQRYCVTPRKKRIVTEQQDTMRVCEPTPSVTAMFFKYGDYLIVTALNQNAWIEILGRMEQRRVTVWVNSVVRCQIK